MSAAACRLLRIVQRLRFRQALGDDGKEAVLMDRARGTAARIIAAGIE